MTNTIEIHESNEPPSPIRREQYFITTDSDPEVYLLCIRGSTHTVSLINILSGSHWSPPIQVADINEITHEEWNELIGDVCTFKRLTSPFTITPGK